MMLAGRTAVVTGGSSGIGAGCAAALRTLDVRVVTWGRRSDQVDVVCDVADEAQVAAAVRRTRELAGVPTLVVMAAGVTGTMAEFPDQPVERWDTTMSVNVRGVFLCIRDLAREMIAEGVDGSMVVVSSTSGVYVIPTAAGYSASKAAASQLARSAAVDLGPSGIRVNAVCPGPTATPMLGDLMSDPTYASEVASVTPLGRIGTPDLVADGVVNLLRSDWVTGQVVPVDGGESLVSARGRHTLAPDRET